MKTVIEMAREAGFITGPYGIGVPPSRISINYTTEAPWMLEAMESFADLIRVEAIAAEREACANLVFHSPPSDEYESPLMAVYNAIRNRSNT